MTNSIKNVQKSDNMIEKIKKLISHGKFRVTKTVKETKANGWGFKIKQKKIETTFEEVDHNYDERK